MLRCRFAISLCAGTPARARRPGGPSWVALAPRPAVTVRGLRAVPSMTLWTVGASCGRVAVPQDVVEDLRPSAA